MGLLVDGKWVDQWYDTESTGGQFKREASQFHGRIGDKDFPAAKNRYHLYVSLACPWAHRALIFRKLKKLEDVITVSAVEPLMLEHGWEFGAKGDDLYGKKYLHRIYAMADPHYTGRVTVPVLWDKQKKTIVCNESAEIIRMLNSAFNDFTDVRTDYYPAALHKAIDRVNDFVYHNVNNGVYKAGFATTQKAYDEAVLNLFEALDKLEIDLSQSTYLLGDTLTEADWRLFTTLIRFDAVYVNHFKCNIRRLADYPNLSRYVKQLYHVPGVAETVDFKVIKQHYYGSHKMLNPTGIIPMGPVLHFTDPLE